MEYLTVSLKGSYETLKKLGKRVSPCVRISKEFGISTDRFVVGLKKVQSINTKIILIIKRLSVSLLKNSPSPLPPNFK
jgi:hypothetical protein